VRPLRVVLVAAGLVVVLALAGTAYWLFTGGRLHHESGRTTMVLTATGYDKSTVDSAMQVMRKRLSAAGLSDPKVERDLNRIVVSVAGEHVNELVAMAEPGALRFRLALASTADRGSTAGGPPAPDDVRAPAGTAVEVERQEVIAKLGAVYAAALKIIDPDTLSDTEVQAFEPFSRLTGVEVTALPAEIQYKVPTIGCAQLANRPRDAVADPDQQVVACDKGTIGRTKYLLDKAKVVGSDVREALAGNDPSSGGWVVQVRFTTAGQSRWTGLTKEAYGNGGARAVGIVLDNNVLTAPAIRDVIVGNAVISGSFGRTAARTLASQLTSGSLPLLFSLSSAGYKP